MARDFGYVCETEFPGRQIAEYLCRTNCSGDPVEVQRRREMIVSAKYFHSIHPVYTDGSEP